MRRATDDDVNVPCPHGSKPNGLYSAEEMYLAVRDAADRRRQIHILAELNDCAPGCVARIIAKYMVAHEIDPNTFKKK